MTVVLTGYLKSHPATKQEAQLKKVEQSAGTYEETSDRFYELEDDKKYLLWDIIDLAEQLVAS